ncbi:GIY-YIG nuclease family protein [Ferruginibacter sp.]
MFYIYFLYSPSSNIYYVGYTNNYLKRLSEHNGSEKNTFTSKHRPWILKAVFECGYEESLAITIEKFIKKQKSRVLIEKIIDGMQLIGSLAQLVRVPFLRD